MAPPEDDDTRRPGQGRPESGSGRESGPSEETDTGSTGSSRAPEDDRRATASNGPELVRRFFWLDPDMAQHLHQAAAEGERSESEIVRELLRAHYGLD